MTTTPPTGPIRVKVGSVAFLKAAGAGYLIGLDDDGHRIEAMGDWRMLAPLRDLLDGPEPVYVEVDSWQLIAVDDELRVDLSRDAMAERGAFVRSALVGMEAPE